MCKKLEFLSNYNIKNIMFVCNSINYYIAAIKFKELYNLVLMGKRFLIRANDFKELYSTSNDKKHLQEASDMIKSCIITYNSSFDYMNQVVWFGYGLHEYEYINKDKKEHMNDIWEEAGFKNVIKRCTFKNVNHVLANEIQNSAALDLLSLIKGFYKNKSVKFIKQLANTLKHNANYQFEGLQDKEGYTIVSAFDKNGRDIFFGSTYNSPLYKIEDVILNVRDVHIELMKYVHKIIDFMQIVDMAKDFPKFAEGLLVNKPIINNKELKNEKISRNDIVNLFKYSKEFQESNKYIDNMTYIFRNNYDKIYSCPDEPINEKTS